MKMGFLKLGVSAAAAMMVVGCGGGGSSSTFSMLSTGQSFKQTTVNPKMDLLWVVDNSLSMQPLQNAMTSNFTSFISQFSTKGFDFHLAVTATDAYKSGAIFTNNSAYAKFRDGVISGHSGIFEITQLTPSLNSVFVKNASLGMGGSGDERAFSSFKAALNSPLNSGFLRPDSYFAVIILSDEDDFSSATRTENDFSFQGGNGDHNYNDPRLDTVASYENYLDNLTNTSGALRRYSVSAIAVLDSACQAAHLPAASSTIIGQRYIQMVNDTGGVLGSVCDASYANSLNAIQQKIIEQGTQFYLDSTPVVSTIRVVVDSVTVPMDGTNGWTYISASNSIMFHGTAVPESGANISITFDPTSLSF